MGKNWAGGLLKAHNHAPSIRLLVASSERKIGKLLHRNIDGGGDDSAGNIWSGMIIRSTIIREEGIMLTIRVVEKVTSEQDYRTFSHPAAAATKANTLGITVISGLFLFCLSFFFQPHLLRN